MQVNRFNFALKWALILAGISLISMLPFLVSSDDTAAPPVFGIFLSFICMLAQIVVITVAIIKYSRENDNRVSPGNIWAFGGLLVVLILGFNILLAVAAFSIFGMGGGAFGLGMENMSGDMAGIAFTYMFVMAIFYFLIFLVAPITIAGQWRTYEKGGKPGWACLIPIYNIICIAEIGKKPVWWVIMMFIPLVNIVFAIMLLHALVKSFGKDGGWTAGLIFLPFIFYPMLAWGDAQYQYGNFENDDLSVEDHLVE